EHHRTAGDLTPDVRRPELELVDGRFAESVGVDIDQYDVTPGSARFHRPSGRRRPDLHLCLEPGRQRRGDDQISCPLRKPGGVETVVKQRFALHGEVWHGVRHDSIMTGGCRDAALGREDLPFSGAWRWIAAADAATPMKFG